LDVGIESFYTDSNGHHEPNLQFLRKAEKSIKHSQKRIYKKVKGSSGRKKARKLYAKKHLKGRGEAFAYKNYATNRQLNSANASPVRQLEQILTMNDPRVFRPGSVKLGMQFFENV
jgi:putative transposase